MQCSSCHVKVDTEENFTKFLCPRCSKAEIIRCRTCRKQSMEYKCPSCGFTGP